ncbi:DUF177 domain-containing protein [Aquabacterium sp.]|uniref:YceD family protein n=1 Tax=Aquabacterium sp. TaxID=1872578 RepID=UPI0035AE7920
MKNEFNPLKLDVAAFARAQATLGGVWSLSELDRLRAYVPAEVPPEALQPVEWDVQGEQRAIRGGAHEIWLHLHAKLTLPMECQRCLHAVDEQLVVQRSVRFVADEEAAAELDAESDDDVLVLSRAFDLRCLIEDELILELPLVPRHEVCPQPLPVVVDELPDVAAEPEPGEADDGGRPNPFAALAALKKGDSSGQH